MYSLARTFTAFAHAQNGRTYGIFIQSMLRRDLVCIQSYQSLHCSRTCTKWVCLWHLLSVNAQTSLSMRAVSPEPSLLSHIHKMSVHTHILSLNAQTRLSMHAVLPEPLLLSTCTKWAYIWHIYSVNAQTRLSRHAVLPEPLLLSHMHKMGVHMAYLFSQCSDET